MDLQWDLVRKEQPVLGPPLVEPDCWVPECCQEIQEYLNGLRLWRTSKRAAGRFMMSELLTRRVLFGLDQTDVKDPTRQALAVFLKDPPQQQEAGIGSFGLLG